MVEEELSFAKLAQQGRTITNEIETKLGQFKMPDLVKAAAPVFLNPEEAATAGTIIDGLKEYSGLGSLREPLTAYLDWFNRCDHFFTMKRCRTDRRAKRFLKHKAQLDKFVNQEITSEKLILSIREQISLLESMEASPPTRRRLGTKRKSQKAALAISPRQEFLLRKVVQSGLLGLFTGTFVGLVSVDAIIAVQAFGLTFIIHLLSSVFMLLYDVTKKETLQQKLLGYLLLASYVVTFSASTFQFIVPLQNFGLISFIALVVILTLTEILVRWGRLELVGSLAYYIERGGYVVLFAGAAYGVSIIIEQPIWVGLSILAALWAAWNNTREKK